MPNGGYPMHLLTPIGDSGMSIIVSGQYVKLRQRLEPGSHSTQSDRPQFDEFGALNEIQTAALLFHLFEWKGSPPNLDESCIREDLARQGFDLRAHYNSHGCFYDY